MLESNLDPKGGGDGAAGESARTSTAPPIPTKGTLVNINGKTPCPECGARSMYEPGEIDFWICRVCESNWFSVRASIPGSE